jgi:hypothetical protein
VARVALCISEMTSVGIDNLGQLSLVMPVAEMRKGRCIYIVTFGCRYTIPKFLLGVEDQSTSRVSVEEFGRICGRRAVAEYPAWRGGAKKGRMQSTLTQPSLIT